MRLVCILFLSAYVAHQPIDDFLCSLCCAIGIQPTNFAEHEGTRHAYTHPTILCRPRGYDVEDEDSIDQNPFTSIAASRAITKRLEKIEAQMTSMNANVERMRDRFAALEASLQRSQDELQKNLFSQLSDILNNPIRNSQAVDV